MISQDTCERIWWYAGSAHIFRAREQRSIFTIRYTAEETKLEHCMMRRLARFFPHRTPGSLFPCLMLASLPTFRPPTPVGKSPPTLISARSHIYTPYLFPSNPSASFQCGGRELGLTVAQKIVVCSLFPPTPEAQVWQMLVPFWEGSMTSSEGALKRQT